MVFKNYRVGVWTRAVALAGTACAMVWVLTSTEWEFAPFFLSLLFVLQIFELTRFHSRWMKGLGNFFEALEQSDFSGQYAKLSGFRGFEPLGEALDRLNKQFKKLQIEQAGQFLYLQTVFEHVQVALVCFERDTHHVELMNEAACNLLHIPYLPQLAQKGYLTEELLMSLQKLPSGRKHMQKIIQQDNILNLAIQVTDFTMQGRNLRLASLQDIKNELDQKEMDSWQKLIRVLTHEIMNSATPISSLSRIISQKMEDADGKLRDFALIEEREAVNMHKSAQTIERRSKGLIKFVSDYKSLTKIPLPHFTEVEVVTLFQRMALLQKPMLDEKGIKLKQRCRPLNLTLKADDDLMEQVFINLLRNAIDALEGMPNPQITLAAQPSAKGGVLIKVADNGMGMDLETQEQIFVPFYTTKTQGSGIGLSLVRQIVHLHKGQIRVSARPGEGTVFFLEL